MLLCEQEANGNHLVVRLRGELDFLTAPDAAKVLRMAVERSSLVVVDLAALEFMDCGGLGAIIAARNLARQRDGDLLLIGAKGIARRLLEILGFPESATLQARPQTTGS